MENKQLPESVYCLGTYLPPNDFRPVGFKLDNDLAVVGIWTTEQAVRAYIAHDKCSSPYFAMPTHRAITILAACDSIQYAVIDLCPNDPEMASARAFRTLDRERVLTLASPVEVWPYLAANWSEQTDVDVVAAVERYVLSNRNITTAQLMKDIGENLRDWETLPYTDSESLVELGLFELAWVWWRREMARNGVSESGQRMVRDVWESHKDFLAQDAQDFLFEKARHRISELATAEELESIWATIAHEFAALGAPDDVVQQMKALVYASESTPLVDAIESARSSLAVPRDLVPDLDWTRDVNRFLPDDLRHAIEHLAPSPECDRCGESNWSFVSLSKTRQAAKWKCGYCGHKEIIRVADILRRETPRREPIPKQVQHEVWQRDNGKCCICGSQEFLEFDHMIPVARGEANTARNIQLLCATCNRQKSDREPGLV